MKLRRAWWAVGLMLVAGCSQNGGSSSSVPDSSQVSRRAEIEGQVTERLFATKARLDSLRNEAAVLGAKLDTHVAGQIAAIEVEKDSAQVELARLQQASKEKWEDARLGFAVMLDSLDTRIDRLRQDLHRRG